MGVVSHVLGLGDAEVFLDLEGVAAVDDEGVAGDKRRVFGTEKGDGGGDVGGTAAAADGVLGFEELQAGGVLVPQAGLDALSNDVAGGDGVDADAVASRTQRPSGGWRQ